MTSLYEPGEKFIRVIQLYQRLCDTTVGITTQQLSDELEVSARSVQRYIATLRDSVGIDVEEVDGRWRIGEFSKLPAMQLDRYQAVDLFIALRLLHKMRLDHDPALIGALAQLSRTLTIPAVTQYLAETITDAEQRPLNEERRRIERAIVDGFIMRTSVRITYRDGKGNSTSRIIDPYFIEPRPEGRTLYVFAHDHSSKSVRAFRLDRIVEAQSVGTAFTVDPSFDVASITAQSWGVWLSDDAIHEEVVLRFSAAVATKVQETPPHARARFEKDTDGAVRLIVEVTNSIEMRPWILGWGADVEVLAPAKLRNDVAATLADAAQQY